MSLFSLRNFVSPFQNKVHLVTIILMTTVFATFRLSGSSLEVQHLDKKAPRGTPQYKSPAQAEQALQRMLSADAVDVPADPAREVQRLSGQTRSPSTALKPQPFSLSGANTGNTRVEEVINSGPIVPKRNEQETIREQQQEALDQARSLSDIEKRLGLK